MPTSLLTNDISSVWKLLSNAGWVSKLYCGWLQDSKKNSYLICVVWSGPTSIHAMCGHDSSQVVALHQEFVLVLAALFVNVNDSSGDLRYSLNHHLQSKRSEKLDLFEATDSQLKSNPDLQARLRFSFPPYWRYRTTILEIDEQTTPRS